MNSRVHRKYKTKYRVNNWASYDRALVERGDITIWLSPEAIADWEPARSGKRGGQWKYSDLAIETALTPRLAFKLPLRQSAGFGHLAKTQVYAQHQFCGRRRSWVDGARRESSR